MLDRRRHVGLDGDVAPNEARFMTSFSKCGCGRFAVLGSAGCDHDRRLHRRGAGDPLADTLASAGHDRDLVGEQSGHPGIQAAVDHQRRSDEWSSSTACQPLDDGCDVVGVIGDPAEGRIVEGVVGCDTGCILRREEGVGSSVML